MVGLAAMGLAVISIGNMFFQPLLYLDEIVLTMAKLIVDTTSSVAIANYFEKVWFGPRSMQIDRRKQSERKTNSRAQFGGKKWSNK